MALLETCCGCSLVTSSAVLGVYLLVAYVIAFAFELWWILDPSVSSPVAAYFLCLVYFALFAFSTVLLYGLSIKRTTFLLLWLFMMGIFLGPEAGLVLYISIHYWRITSLNGLIEITCWACRLLVNAVGIVCVQSLQSNWREEKSVLLRLEALKAQTPMHASNHENRGKTDSKSHAHDISNMSARRFREDEVVFKSGHFKAGYVDPYFASGINEFDASSFDSRLPHRTTIGMIPDEFVCRIGDTRIAEKTHSLLDLSEDNLRNVEVMEFGRWNDESESVGIAKDPKGKETGSLDRRIIKNKNLKILKRSMSPFCKRKSVETINVYRINPRSGPEKGGEATEAVNVSNLDSQLRKVYSSRGMYAFEENSRKIVFYPPEFFRTPQTVQPFRSRMNSYGSSLSQSSIDSEDIKQISDVAL